MSQLKLQPQGLPNNRKHFSFRDLTLETSRQFQITFIANYKTFFYQLLFYICNLGFLATIFSRDMVLPNGCSSLDGKLNETCQNEIKQGLQLFENVNYLSVSLGIVGYGFISSSTVIFAPLIKVFRNEHRNSK